MPYEEEDTFMSSQNYLQSVGLPSCARGSGARVPPITAFIDLA